MTYTKLSDDPSTIIWIDYERMNDRDDEILKSYARKAIGEKQWRKM